LQRIWPLDEENRRVKIQHFAKEWVRLPGTDVEAFVKPAKTFEAAYVPNPNLPPDCVEISPDVKLKPEQDYWDTPHR
jgi:hypothetical protein